MSDVEKPLCTFCGSTHPGLCPKIAAIEYFESGEKRMVHFFPQDNITAVSLESDENYRSRLLRAVTTDSVNYNLVTTAIGAALDKIGSYYDLTRVGAQP